MQDAGVKRFFAAKHFSAIFALRHSPYEKSVSFMAAIFAMPDFQPNSGDTHSVHFKPESFIFQCMA